MEWRLETRDGETTYATSYEAALADLRAAVWPSLGALLLATLAWIILRRFSMAVGLAVISLAISAQVIPLTGSDVLSSAVVVGALVGVAVWLAGWGATPRVQAIMFVAPIAAATVWLSGRYLAWPIFDLADALADGTMAAGLVAMVVGFADWSRWRGRLLTLESGRVADLVAIAAALAMSVFVAMIVEAPLLLLIAVAFGLVLLYPRLRRRMADTIDQLILGDVRGTASLRAVEDERGRIARDLHDEPLQEIAAAIRQLDQRPGTEAEAELLRRAAGHIRRVTTELRPPVLDDLGLSAAIAFVVDQAAATAPHINFSAAVYPEDPLAERAPADIELAVFRVVQEAVDNARRHSGAGSIEVAAHVTPTEVIATVEDDGIGLPDGAAREAMLAGHVGLVSMSQRATLIGAAFEIGRATPHGTVLRLHWTKPR
jgi:signal transduction histidine kinase